MGILLAAYLLLGGIVTSHASAASNSAVQRLEHVYLRELTRMLFDTAQRYAHVAGKAPGFAIEQLLALEQCRPLFADLQQQHTELLAVSKAAKIDGDTYFEHLLTLSLALAHMNRRLYELGIERDNIKKNFMRSVTGGGDLQRRIAAIDAQLETLDTKINTVFAADPANLLLTVKVGVRKLPLYQEIVAGYYHQLSKGVTGLQLISAIRADSQVLVDAAWEEVSTRNSEFLQRAWQHLCVRRKHAALLAPGFVSLGFYVKHRLLVARVNTLLQEQGDTELIVLQHKVEDYFKQRIVPQHYRSSAKSFFGLLAALTAPAFLASSKYNKITLPLMAVSGVSYSGYRTKALYDMQRQLEAGALAGVNSYDLYHDFKRNTSLGRYAFSHLSVVALALVLRRMPAKPAMLKNVDTKLLAVVSAASSLSSMFFTEAVQAGSINFLKDRDFLYNMFIVTALDFSLAWIASKHLPYETQIALTAAASVALSVAAHVISGKEINWDRIIFDTTYVSTYSLYKAKYFYTGGSRLLIRKLKEHGIDRKGTATAVTGVMALLNNILGNVPYSIIARNWVEHRSAYNKFPVQDAATSQAGQHTDLEQELDRLLVKHNLEDPEFKRIFLKWLHNTGI